MTKDPSDDQLVEAVLARPVRRRRAPAAAAVVATVTSPPVVVIAPNVNDPASVRNTSPVAVCVVTTPLA